MKKQTQKVRMNKRRNPNPEYVPPASVQSNTLRLDKNVVEVTNSKFQLIKKELDREFFGASSDKKLDTLRFALSDLLLLLDEAVK